MSRNAIRVGAPVQPTVTTPGSPGTSDQVRTFLSPDGRDVYTRPCFITNTDGADTLFILVNEIDASNVNYLAKLAPGQAVDISVEGQIDVNFVSLYYASAAYTAALVRGWTM